MLTEVNVERCEVVSVNILQHAFLWIAIGGGLLLGLFSRTFYEETRCHYLYLDIIR